MIAYQRALDSSGTTMLLTPDSEFFRFFGDPEGRNGQRQQAPGEAPLTGSIEPVPPQREALRTDQPEAGAAQ